MWAAKSPTSESRKLMRQRLPQKWKMKRKFCMRPGSGTECDINIWAFPLHRQDRQFR